MSARRCCCTIFAVKRKEMKTQNFSPCTCGWHASVWHRQGKISESKEVALEATRWFLKKYGDQNEDFLDAQEGTELMFGIRLDGSGRIIEKVIDMDEA